MNEGKLVCGSGRRGDGRSKRSRARKGVVMFLLARYHPARRIASSGLTAGARMFLTTCV